MTERQLSAGINGFGRFALNLLAVWWDDVNATYSIDFINDEELAPKEIVNIIQNDAIVRTFRKAKVALLDGSTLVIESPLGKRAEILISQGAPECVPWLGKPRLWLECSGKRSSSSQALCAPFICGDTEHVVVSATAHDADATLVYGFNHQDFDKSTHKIISYGSCTVNPGITLGQEINEAYGVTSMLVNVVHNVQGYNLDNGHFNTLHRKSCTLEVVAPRLLPFLEDDQIQVLYTVVPWRGASLIDFVFDVKTRPTREEVLRHLRTASREPGGLAGLIELVASDCGPESVLESRYSMSIVEQWTHAENGKITISGYFYNEGSGSRLHDLVKYLVTALDS